MRRIRRRKKNKKIPILFAVLLLLFVSSGYALLNSELNINGFASLSFTDDNQCDYNVSATYNNDNTWGGEDGNVYYHVILTIYNNDIRDITDWVMKIKGPSDLIVQANANVISSENGIITLTPYSWNSFIGAGNNLAFDMALITTQENFEPEWIKLNDCLIYGDISDDNDPGIFRFTLYPESYSMNIGESITLQINTTTYSNASNIKWTSGNSDVAVVDSNGKVTAVGEGKTKVTATIEGVSASSEITVNNNDTNDNDTNDIDIKFVVTNSWGSSIQYKITITNNFSSDINGCSFDLGMPNGSLYIIWSSNIYANSNTISCDNKIVKGNSYDIYGQVDLPNGYSINNYLNPNISNITIK